MKPTNAVNTSCNYPETIPTGRSPATCLFNLIESALTELHGRKLTYDDLAQIAGQSTATVFNWAGGANLRQVEAMVRLLEQVPEPKRAELVNRVCRQMPTIGHERISWRERQVSICKQLLGETCGITVLRGDENARDFVMTALGHSLRGFERPSNFWGIDARRPDYFVPVNHITYLGHACDIKKQESLAHSTWASYRLTPAGTVFLNGVWRMFRERLDDLGELATRSHLIIADEMSAPTADLPGARSVSLRQVVLKEEKDHRITFEIELV